jgi:hypothetical protein
MVHRLIDKPLDLMLPNGHDGIKHPSGAKARADFAGILRGLKPPPPSGKSSLRGYSPNIFLQHLRHD